MFEIFYQVRRRNAAQSQIQKQVNRAAYHAKLEKSSHLNARENIRYHWTGRKQLSAFLMGNGAENLSSVRKLLILLFLFFCLAKVLQTSQTKDWKMSVSQCSACLTCSNAREKNPVNRSCEVIHASCPVRSINICYCSTSFQTSYRLRTVHLVHPSGELIVLPGFSKEELINYDLGVGDWEFSVPAV